MHAEPTSTDSLVVLNDVRFARRFPRVDRDELPHRADDVRDAMFDEFGSDPSRNVRRACALYALRRSEFLWARAIEQLRSLVSHTPSDRETEARIERMLSGLRFVGERELYSAAAKVALIPGDNGPASWGA